MSAVAPRLYHLRDRMACGRVLHTGPPTFELDQHIGAAPIAALWSETIRTH